MPCVDKYQKPCMTAVITKKMISDKTAILAENLDFQDFEDSDRAA